MSTHASGPLERLLVETEAAHGTYETTELGGAYDQGWPRWYATYAAEHGIGSLVGRDITVEEMTDLLSRAWDELSSLEPRPAEPWASWTARWLSEELG